MLAKRASASRIGVKPTSKRWRSSSPFSFWPEWNSPLLTQLYVFAQHYSVNVLFLFISFSPAHSNIVLFIDNWRRKNM